MALLEAGAFAKPVVSTDTCGVQELLSDGEAGRVVAPEDAEAMAQAILQLLADPTEAAREGARLAEVVRERFTWGQAHARYLELADAGTTRQAGMPREIASESWSKQA